MAFSRLVSSPSLYFIMKFPERKGQTPQEWVAEHRGEKFKRPRGTMTYEVLGITANFFGLQVEVRANEVRTTRISWRELRRMKPVPVIPSSAFTSWYDKLQADDKETIDRIIDDSRLWTAEYTSKPTFKTNQPINQPINQPDRRAPMANMPMVLRNTLPDYVSDTAERLAKYNAWNAVNELTRRHSESQCFTSDSAPYLAGIAMEAREEYEGSIDFWAESSTQKRLSKLPKKGVDEVVIGSGIHAAIYCAVRRKMGKPRPVVVEQNQRIGGIFAMTRGPAFYLNSRNRPGPLSIPGDAGGGLNVIPEAPIQPCDLSMDEYQRNNDLAFAIRTTLLMHSTPLVGMEATGIGFASSYDASIERAYALLFANGERIFTDRIIQAVGLGRPRNDQMIDGKRILSYEQFMRRLDERMPFEGMRRVAVVGAGDSGKTVVEALIGQGPSAGWSTATADSVEGIDWFEDEIPISGNDWEVCNRSRYKGIARFMPRDGVVGKIRPRSFNVSSDMLQVGYDRAYVGAEPYDCVVICNGFARLSTPCENLYSPINLQRGGRVVGYAYGSEAGGLYCVGPAARIDLNSYENDRYGSVAENGTAIFRLAERTAMVAATT